MVSLAAHAHRDRPRRVSLEAVCARASSDCGIAQPSDVATFDPQREEYAPDRKGHASGLALAYVRQRGRGESAGPTPLGHDAIPTEVKQSSSISYKSSALTQPPRSYEATVTKD